MQTVISLLFASYWLKVQNGQRASFNRPLWHPPKQPDHETTQLISLRNATSIQWLARKEMVLV